MEVVIFNSNIVRLKPMYHDAIYYIIGSLNSNIVRLKPKWLR